MFGNINVTFVWNEIQNIMFAKRCICKKKCDFVKKSIYIVATM